MKGTFFDELQIDLPDACVGHGGCWRYPTVAGDNAWAWGPGEIKHFFGLLNMVQNPVFLDVGANTGSVALLAAHLPASRCIAFEPCHETYRALVLAVAMNSLANVKVVNAALGDRNGTADLFLPDGPSTGMARIGLGGDGFSKSQAVEMFRLDSYMERQPEKPDFISIDVEGRELEVLLGASKTLFAWHPGIQIEWCEEHAQRCGHSLTQVDALLNLLGYDNHKTLSDTDRYYWKT